MKVMVVGVSGFIGTPLCFALLSDGHEVLGLSRSSPKKDLLKTERFKWISYTLGCKLPDKVVEFEPEIIVNLVWEGIPNFSNQVCIKNLNQQIAFVEETRKIKTLKKIITTGTCKEYSASNGPCFEADRFAPDNYFSLVKQALADYLLLSCKERGIKCIWFRIFYVYGPGQRSESLVPALIKAISAGNTPDIKNPEAAHDFIYLADVVKALRLSVESEDAEGIFNIGSGKLNSVGEISRVVKRIMDSNKSSIDRLDASFDRRNCNVGIWANTEKIEKFLKWKPSFSMLEGLMETCKENKFEDA